MTEIIRTSLVLKGQEEYGFIDSTDEDEIFATSSSCSRHSHEIHCHSIYVARLAIIFCLNH